MNVKVDAPHPACGGGNRVIDERIEFAFCLKMTKTV